MKYNTMTEKEEALYKASLFNEADVLYTEASENYEMGYRDIAEDFENRFKAILNELTILGWDREYMGIA